MLLRVLKKYVFIALICLALCGCDEQLPPGTVATVDGKPIALRTLQTVQDMRTAGLGAFEKPSLASLRQQYGAALTTLIAYELVLQEVERLGMPVSDAAVNEAEQRIRADYPEDEFDKYLAESAIDLNAWRELMRYRLGLNTFSSQVLRPRMVLPLAEVEAFYKEKEANFVVPSSVTLYQVLGEEKEKVEALREQGDFPEDSKDAEVFRLTLSRASVSEQWQKKLQKLKNGECSTVAPWNGKYEFICLIDNKAESKMTIAEALPYIEEILLEDRMDKVLEEWLEKKLMSAKVYVSTHLLEEMREKEK